jgi:hypothetical protein
MKPDDFENHLERQPMRQIPSRWRDEILDAARRAGGHQLSTPNPQPISWWRELLWPCPQAWAGLAAAWCLILLLNVASREAAVTANRRTAPLSKEFMMALREQKRLFVELVGPLTPIEPAATYVPRPRSERLPRNLTA